ncbi:hypothetical protein [Providencia phage vB_PreS-PatoteraRojo]|nr:hypothetical protein [Providencia phage vB_PreS-PatoteraRojo]
MPQRKVLQTVILHRESGRIVPTVGQIFDFTAEELASINRLNPEALGRPVQEVDLENQAAQEAAAKAKAEQEAAEAAAAAKANANKGKNKGGKDNSDDEV